MLKWILALLLAAFAALGLGFARLGLHSASEGLEQANRHRLEIAMMSVQAAIEGLHDSGFARWTPTEAAARLVESLNSAERISPEEEEELRRAGVRFMPAPVSYALDVPTAPWQVVLIPAESNGVIRVEAYGAELDRPVLTQDFRVQ